MGAPGTMKADLWQFPPSEFLLWLKAQDIEEDICSLFQQHLIGGISFSLLTEDDLREMGIRRIGDRKRLMFLIQNWRRGACLNFSPVSKATISSLSSDFCEDLYVTERQRPYHRNKRDPVLLSECETNPKLWKVAISFLYCLFSLGVTAFAMVLTHERLPDSSKYPPLPDIILDNLPYIPWAFEAAELVVMMLLVIWIVVLICHRHRFILFRRYCSLIGTVFLLRSITMCITSLSVPGHHLSTECFPYLLHSFRDRAARAFDIWLGMGMTLRGVRTCGDYMFSGHTAVITMLNFFITEYTPASTMYRLHTFTWVLNIFGVFFILAAHEHYSIDVFIAAYITSRLFLYYHWLANNYNSNRSDIKKTKICFPLFSFFESDVQGPVPPQFSNPLVDLSSWLSSHLKAWRNTAHGKNS